MKVAKMLIALALVASLAGVAYVSQANEPTGVKMTGAAEKFLTSLSAEQKKWVQQAADDMNRVQPAKAFEMERESRAKLQKMGVKIVEGVDKTEFQKTSAPILEKITKELGPHAVKILGLVRSIK